MRTLTELMNILAKALKNEDYLLDYPYEDEPTLEITCTVWGEEIYPFVRDVGPAEYADDEYTVKYDYDKDDLVDCLKTSLQNEKEEVVAKIISKVNEYLLNEFIETFIGSLTEIYYKDVVDYFYDDAAEQAQEEYDEELESSRADAEIDAAEEAAEARWEAMLDKFGY